MRVPTISLAVRVRNEWELLAGLLESVRGICREAWILDDASEVPHRGELTGILDRVTVMRATEWSGRAGRFGEGMQRDHLLQRLKRESECAWVLQLDADERLDGVEQLTALVAAEGVDGWVLPLVDFYITPADAGQVDLRQPAAVRTHFGVETRWTLALYRPLKSVYISRGDVREPQGLRSTRVREVDAPLIEHFGKSVSVAEWERKVDFYATNYPAYRDKWLSRRGRAVHDGESDFGTTLLTRHDPRYDPRAAPVIHRYRVETNLRSRARQLVHGIGADKVRGLKTSVTVIEQ